jgi:hypothetical protein
MASRAECGLGVIKHRLQGQVRGSHQRDADTHRDPQPLALPGNLQLLDTFADAFRSIQRTQCVSLGQKHRHLGRAEAGQRIGTPEGPGDVLDKLLHRALAHPRTAPLVQAAEAVQVHQQQRRPVAVSPRPVKLALGERQEAFPAAQRACGAAGGCRVRAAAQAAQLAHHAQVPGRQRHEGQAGTQGSRSSGHPGALPPHPTGQDNGEPPGQHCGEQRHQHSRGDRHGQVCRQRSATCRHGVFGSGRQA